MNSYRFRENFAGFKFSREIEQTFYTRITELIDQSFALASLGPRKRRGGAKDLVSVEVEIRSIRASSERQGMHLAVVNVVGVLGIEGSSCTVAGNVYHEARVAD